MVNHCIALALIQKNSDKNNEFLGAVQLGMIIFCQVRDLKNLDLLDSGVTNYVYNFQNDFINF